MIRYKVTKFNPTKLEELWKENRQLVTIYEWIMYFSKTEKQTRKAKLSMQFPEYTEFITFYRKINNNWSYDDRLIAKYKDILKDVKHESIMNNLEEYKLFLEFNKTRSPLQVWSYLNRKGYLEKWEIVKDMSKKWIDNIFKERKLDKYTIDTTLLEIDNRERKNNKEITSWVLDKLIHYVQTWEIK